MNNNTSKPSSTTVVKFVESLCQLDEVELIGLAKLLGISLVEPGDEKHPRPFEFVLSDMIDKYVSCDRNKRRKINSVLKAATKGHNSRK